MALLKTPTTTNKNNAPASWGSLETYLKKNNIDYSKGITDYSALDTAYEGGKINYDEYQRGQLYVKNYLADLQAQSDLGVKQAEIENTARVNTAYNDFLGKKLSSYLQEIQGNAGLVGYDGVTKGQAINIANTERNAQQEVMNIRDSDKANALKAYQDTVRSNADSYQDDRTSLQATLDERDANDYNNKKDEVNGIIKNSLDADDKITKSKWDETVKYIDGLEISDTAKTNLKNYYETAYKDAVITDEQAAAKVAATKRSEISALTRDNFDSHISTLQESDKTAYKADLDKKEEELYPKGRCVDSSIKSKYKADGTYEFTYDGKTRRYMESINDNPLGSDTGTFTKKEAEEWGMPNPDNYSYKDVIAVKKGNEVYFYVKRNGKWIYIYQGGKDQN